MAMLGSTVKQPNEIESYSVVYEDDLEPTDSILLEEISISSATGADLPVIDTSGVFEQRVRMFISGGVDGQSYKVTVRVRTDTGRVLEDEFRLRIKDF